MFAAIITLQREVRELTKRVGKLEEDSHPPVPTIPAAEYDRTIGDLRSRLDALEGKS